jgi:K+-sensing histidine kinase KdpD
VRVLRFRQRPSAASRPGSRRGHGVGFAIVDQCAAATGRGTRLDETAPGSGLGLSIMDELARAYGGALRLGESRMGGLKVELDLPLAES